VTGVSAEWGMPDGERIVEVVFGALAARRLIERAERPSLHRCNDLRRSFALFGRDGDHATQRICTIEAALRSAQDFDLSETTRQQLPEIDTSMPSISTLTWSELAPGMKNRRKPRTAPLSICATTD
jgi:hypothetical protein